MAKVIGIGGIFFKSKDPKKLGEWYKTWLNIEIDPSFGGATFKTTSQPKDTYTVWSPFKESTTYFEPSDQHYMINLIVDDLDGALEQVEKGGGKLVGVPDDIDYGKFGWFMDPEGNKVELWQPN